MAEIVSNATVRNPVFWVSFLLCAGLLIAGFLVPPTGSIDGSVLTGVGELFAFPTLWTVWHGIDKGIDARLKHGNTEVTIGDLKQTEEKPKDEDYGDEDD